MSMKTQKRVLFISFDVNQRTHLLAKHMYHAGWEPYLLTALSPEKGFEFEQILEIPESNWVQTDWYDWVQSLRKAYYSGRRFWSRSPDDRNVTSGRNGQISTPIESGGLVGSMVRAFPLSGVRMPDVTMGWIPYAVKAGLSLVRDKRIDVIYASAMPISAFFVASLVSQKSNTPWIAEYRDTWTTNFWARRPRGVQQVEQGIERLLLRKAGMIVGTSDFMAEELCEVHHKQVTVMPHCFDAERYGISTPLLPDFTISYTGTMSARREPDAFFSALANLREDGRMPPGLRVRFAGRGAEFFLKPAKHYRVDDLVNTYGELSVSQLPKFQMESTVLLSLETTDADARWLMPFKLGEYLGARRPVLAFSPRPSVVESVLHETGAGALAVDVEDATSVLARWFHAYSEGDFNLGLEFRNDFIQQHYTYHARAIELAQELEGVIVNKSH